MGDRKGRGSEVVSAPGGGLGDTSPPLFATHLAVRRTAGNRIEEMGQRRDPSLARKRCTDSSVVVLSEHVTRVSIPILCNRALESLLLQHSHPDDFNEYKREKQRTTISGYRCVSDIMITKSTTIVYVSQAFDTRVLVQLRPANLNISCTKGIRAEYRRVQEYPVINSPDE